MSEHTNPTVLERLRELMLHGVDEPLPDSFTYSWNHGYEELHEGNMHYSGTFHPGNGYCEGNPCRYCGHVWHE